MVVLATVLICASLSACSGRHSKATPRAPHRTNVSAPRTRRGFWQLGTDAEIFAFGDAVAHGSPSAQHVNRPVACMSSTPSGGGYWLVAADGGIFAFGDARYYGSTASAPLERPIVAMAAAPTGHGYWLAAANGAVFAFGDAHAYGQLVGRSLDQPVVGIAATPSGHGYWLVTSDGRVAAFGDGRDYGSPPPVRVNAPVIGLTPSPSGRGYRVATADGKVFAFGDATSYGSPEPGASVRPIVALATTPSGNGYWLARDDGTVLSYGDAPPERPRASLGTTILGMAGLGGAATCHLTPRPSDVAHFPGASGGEGHWAPSAGNVGGAPAIFTTTLPARAGLPSAGLAWIDANRVVFRLYAGLGQPSGTFLYGNYVDPTLQTRLLATFNAGFKVNASEGGWVAYGHTAIPLRDGAASFIIRSDGTATVGMWGRDATADPHIVAVRQNLRLLVDGGKPASDLSPRSWGAVFGGGPTTWRSGLGVDAGGRLIYVVGPGLLPADLAELLLAAGSVRAMQLDINRVVSFSTFTTATQSRSHSIVGVNLLPALNFAPTRYLRPGDRDFIAVFAA